MPNILREVRVLRQEGKLHGRLIGRTRVLLGMFVFSRMNPIQWNEEKEVIETGRMDAIGYTIVALYIVIEISLRTFLQHSFPISATALLLAGVFGMLFGRVVGTVIEIHRVYTSSHTD